MVIQYTKLKIKIMASPLNGIAVCNKIFEQKIKVTKTTNYFRVNLT